MLRERDGESSRLAVVNAHLSNERWLRVLVERTPGWRLPPSFLLHSHRTFSGPIIITPPALSVASGSIEERVGSRPLVASALRFLPASGPSTRRPTNSSPATAPSSRWPSTPASPCHLLQELLTHLQLITACRRGNRTSSPTTSTWATSSTAPTHIATAPLTAPGCACWRSNDFDYILACSSRRRRGSSRRRRTKRSCTWSCDARGSCLRWGCRRVRRGAARWRCRTYQRDFLLRRDGRGSCWSRRRSSLRRRSARCVPLNPLLRCGPFTASPLVSCLLFEPLYQFCGHVLELASNISRQGLPGARGSWRARTDGPRQRGQEARGTKTFLASAVFAVSFSVSAASCCSSWATLFCSLATSSWLREAAVTSVGS